MNQADNSRWRRVRFWLLVGAVIFFVNNLIIFSGMNNGPGINKVTVWDWVGVLIIPVGLLIAGIWINAAQVRREETVASHRAQDEAVQTYLRDMSELVIKHQLRAESPDPDICKVAQARTIAVLLVLDAKRKRHTLRLVYELGLINRDKPVIDLKNADLNKADLRELALADACLNQVDLRGTDLSGSNLKGCNLRKADLRGANLTNVDLSDADLTHANLLPFDEGEPAKMSIHNLRDREVDSTEAETEVDGILPRVKNL